MNHSLAIAGSTLIALAALWPLFAVVIYPTWLWLRSVLAPVGGAEDPERWPEVSVIVAARDAEELVERKVRELLAMDYPDDRLRVIVVSDGSTDATAERARAAGDPRLEVIELTENLGKTAAVNAAVRRATGEVLAFSDVSTRWRPDALKKMVRRCVSPGAGCAGGRILYRGGEGAVAQGFGLYQHLEIRLRDLAGTAGLLPSVSGAMHVVKRAHWRPIPESLTADLVLPQLVHADGAGVLYAADAIGEEAPRESVKQELRARVRIAVRSVQSAAWTAPMLLRAGRLGPLFALLCHKVARWSVWIPAALLLVGSALLAVVSWVWAAALAVQLIVYGAGGLHLKTSVALLPRGLQAVATYWTLAALALAKGTLRGLFGEAMTRWNPED